MTKTTTIKKASKAKASPKKAVTKTSSAGTAAVNNRPAISALAASFDVVEPVPLSGAGRALSIVSGSPYLPFLGREDNFARLLLQSELNSVTHRACIATKKDYCAGLGFQDENNKDFTPEMIAWFGSMNLKNQSAAKINQLAFESDFRWGNGPIELVRFTSNKTKRLFVYVHDFQEWRLGKPDANDICTYAIGSKLFRREGVYLSAKELNEARQLPLYSPYNTDRQNWVKDAGGSERTMIWYKNEVLGVPYYGLPSAIASLIYQLNEFEGASYDYDNFINNLVAGTILTLTGTLSDGETLRIGRKINSTYTGRGKRGRTVVVASEENGGIKGSEIHNLDTKKEGSYIQADERWMQKIILAHQWDAVLAGLVSSFSLGKGAGFLTKIKEDKLTNVIKPRQADIIRSVWKDIFAIAQDWLGLPFDQYSIGIKNPIDISGLTDVDITPAVTIDEVRVAKGLPKLGGDKGNQLMKATGSLSQQSQGGSDVSN